MRRVRVAIAAVEKQWVLYNPSVFVVLGTQHKMRMRHIVVFGLPRSKVFFSALSHKRNDFRNKNLRK